MTEEFLLVDLANNLDNLAEDRDNVLNKLITKASQMPSIKLKNAIVKYGNIKTKKLLKSTTSNPKRTEKDL